MSDASKPEPDTRGRTCLAIILAAGEGTRMRSALAKPLHAIANRTLLAHVVGAVSASDATRVAIVTGPGRDDVAAEAARHAPDALHFVQTERRGTAHAVLAARAALADATDVVVVAFADTPLVRPETFRQLQAAIAGGAEVAVLGFEAADPTGYGRILREGGAVAAIREHAEASASEKRVTLCNAGLMAFDGRAILPILGAITDANAKREFFLTDAVAIARSRGATVALVEAPEAEVLGVNDRVQLAAAEAAFQDRLRREAMLAGATLVAPETVFLSADTRFAPDTLVEPHCVFGPRVSVGAGARIRAFSHLEGAEVGEGAIVGPYARLRPGAKLGPDVHVGNFVEVKNADLGRGVKANHLAYLGDATVGAGTNVGAGTITCNYDGAAKHRTQIGTNVFVGTNTSLVAPVAVGDNAYIGSGSVITADVPADALALGRGRQVNKAGWAASRPRKGR